MKLKNNKRKYLPFIGLITFLLSFVFVTVSKETNGFVSVLCLWVGLGLLGFTSLRLANFILGYNWYKERN
ncbi:MAG: hypothetical protein AB1521_06875 [Bacteroidota bacterium]